MSIDRQIQQLVEQEVTKQVQQAIADLPKHQAPRDQTWLTGKEFCKRYSVARSTLQRMKEQGRVEVLNGGGRMVRYRWEAEISNTSAGNNGTGGVP